MRREIRSSSFMLPLISRAGIDTNTGNPLLVRTTDIMKTIAHHHGVIDSGTKLRHSVANGFRLGIATGLQSAHNRIKGREIERIDHLACRCLKTRCRDGNPPTLFVEASNQLAHAGKDRVIIGRHIPIKNPTVHLGDTYALFERLMTEISKAIAERRTD